MTDTPNFIAQTFDSLISGSKPDLERAMLAFMIGERGKLGRKEMASAILAWRTLNITPSTMITILFGGYDEDPRELWEIPEVRKFVQRFCGATRAHEHRQVEPMSRNLLLLCGADPNLHVTVNPITEQEALRQSMDFFKQTLQKDKP